MTEPTLNTFNVNVGGTLNIPLAASGGTPPYTFDFTSQPLDPGMSIETSPIDKFVFNPTSTGTYAVTLKVIDSADLYYDKKVTVNVGTGSNSPPNIILPFEGQHYWLFNGYGYGWELRGDDPDGCTGLGITASNIPQGPPFGPLALTYESPPDCDTNDFISDIYYGPVPFLEVGNVYNSVFTVSDGMATDQLNMVISIHEWQRILTNPLNGGESFTIEYAGERMEEVKKLDGSGWEVGEEIQVDMRFGELPPTKTWNFSFYNFLGSCTTPPGATIESISGRVGRFTFTPTGTGLIDICVKANWNGNLNYMPGQSDHRLYRFEIQPGAGPPDLELVLNPVLDPHIAFVNEPYFINISGINGVPAYEFDWAAGPPAGFSFVTGPDRIQWIAPSVLSHLNVSPRITDSDTPASTDVTPFNIISSDLSFAPMQTVFNVEVGEQINEAVKIEGGFTPVNDPIADDLTNPPITPAPDISITGSMPFFVFNFRQDSDLGVGTYIVRLSVNDSDGRVGGGVTRTIELTINVSTGGGGGNPPPGPNEYIVQLDPYIICNKNQILNPLRDGTPTNPDCIDPSTTLGLVDKIHFIEPVIDGTGFNSICFMNQANRQLLISQGSSANVNDMIFENTENGGRDYFEHLCRSMNKNYRHYKSYILNVIPDVDADIIIEEEGPGN